MYTKLFARFFFLLGFLHISGVAKAQPQWISQSQLLTGSQQTELYLPLLQGKSIAVVANQSSTIGNTHLIDSLISLKIEVKKIFSPEHGFSGKADAGALIHSSEYENTGIPIVSLYGKKKQPTQADMSGIDWVIFDLQDVGVRFFTYISTLAYMMQACAEAGVPLLLLDRPNPNGFYVDGPVLQNAFKSFVGLHPVPVVYGLTIGEYATMVNGEGWLDKNLKCELTVIPLKGYSHNLIVDLNQIPSPNLKSWQAVYLYPSLCFFEGTVASVGRGTPSPFEVYGHPDFKNYRYSFTPVKMTGASEPKFLGQKCFGEKLSDYPLAYASKPGGIDLNWLIKAYKQFDQKQLFFNTYFNLLAGTAKLRQQIEAGMDAQSIRQSWAADLDTYKKIRAKYLLYPD